MSDYIMDLRKIVGHRPLLQVGASVIVEDEKGRILLQKRLHLIRISGEDHNNVIPVVFHLLDNGIDRFIAVGIVPVINQRVGFIDK